MFKGKKHVARASMNVKLMRGRGKKNFGLTGQALDDNVLFTEPLQPQELYVVTFAVAA